jgi:ABC-type transport system involved in multi-copper enzyme maturation permease subunit
MVGPLFYQELLLGSRRNREYVLRWVYAGWLVLQLIYLAVMEFFSLIAARDNYYFTPAVSREFVRVFVWQHFILLVLATPAFVAGGVSDEKTRGTLQYLLTSDLASIHIIVGKLLGRIVQVLALALVGLPLFCFVGVFGGAEPVLVLGVLLLSVEVVVGVSAATFLAAVWSRQTRDAVLGVYAVGIPLALLVVFVGGPLDWLNPAWVLGPALEPGDPNAARELGRRLFLGLFAWGALALGCLGLAAWRLRPAYMRQLENEGRKRKPHWWRVERPAPDEEPVRWKERNVEGLAPLQWMKRMPRWMGITAIVVGTVLSSGVILYSYLATGVTLEKVLGMLLRLELTDLANAVGPAEDGFLVQGIVAMLFFSLLVGIRCSGSVSGERERQTWEALLLTPLTAHQLIRGKLWGIMGVSYLYLLAYVLPAIPLSLLGGPVAVFWTILWLLVTLLAMFYVGAAGMWSSVRSKSSWRSLLSTLGFGYVGGFIIYLCTTPVLFIVALIIYIFLKIIDNQYGTSLAPTTGGGFAQYMAAFVIATCLGLALIFWLTARLFLQNAQKWVSDRERTRHWHDEPIYRRPRRRVVRAPYPR